MEQKVGEGEILERFPSLYTFEPLQSRLHQTLSQKPAQQSRSQAGAFPTADQAFQLRNPLNQYRFYGAFYAIHLGNRDMIEWL